MTFGIYETKWSMSAAPIGMPSEELFIKKIKTYPLSRLVFVTINDNSHKTRFDKIGKCSDWIRRYSDCYYVVKGTVGGTHHHLLAGLKKDVNLIPHKGIHFNISYLNNESKKLTMEEINDTIKWNNEDDNLKLRTIYENIQYTHPDREAHDILYKIVVGIREYFDKIYQRNRAKETAVKAKTFKETKILRIINYLRKNLDEPRDGTLAQYVDYMYRV